MVYVSVMALSRCFKNLELVMNQMIGVPSYTVPPKDSDLLFCTVEISTHQYQIYRLQEVQILVCHLILHNRFSIGLRSGLFPCHSNSDILFYLWTSVILFYLWTSVVTFVRLQGLVSCMNNSTYLGVRWKDKQTSSTTA